MATNLSELLTDGPVLSNLKCSSVKQVFTRLSDEMAAVTGLSDRDILKAVLDREQLGSTAVGHGVVLPHARLEGLEKPIAGFAKLATPLDFDAVDDQPCDLIVILLAPDGSGADHLRALAKIARVMRQEDVRTSLRSSTTDGEIRDLFGCKFVEKIA